MKLKKGSAAAKAFMAKIRAKKGKVGAKKVLTKKPISKHKDTKSHNVNIKVVSGTKSIYKYFIEYIYKGLEIREKFKTIPRKNKIVNGMYKVENKYGEFYTLLNTQTLLPVASKKSNKKVGAWAKGGTYMIEQGEKPFPKTKNVRVKRFDNGTFEKFKTVTQYNNQMSLLSGYAPKKEIIIGKVSTERKLKDLAPQVKLRISRGKAVDNIIITSGQKSVEVFKKYITKNMVETQEFFAIMYLNNANKCLGVYLVGQGGFTAVVSERRLIMSGALLIGCTGFIMCHNHPSGNLTPSQADKNFTKQLVSLAQEHDIRVIDHVIITKDSYFSFSENGLL